MQILFILTKLHSEGYHFDIGMMHARPMQYRRTKCSNYDTRFALCALVVINLAVVALGVVFWRFF